MRVLCCALLIIVAPLLHAQEKIECDRPDQTETPAIVPANHFQMECGFNYEHESSSEKNIVYPSSLLKYGLKDIAELRLEIENSSSLIRDEAGNQTVHGLNPVSIGMKLKICDEKKARPQTSVIVMMSIPVLATSYRRTDYPTPEIRFTMQHTFGEKFYVAYNLGGLWDGETQKPYGLYTLTGGCEIIDAVGCYIEVYGFVSKEQDHRFDGGFNFFPRKNLMLDISGGISIDRKNPAWYSALGISFRLPD